MTPEQKKRFADAKAEAEELADKLEFLASEIFETTANEMDEEFANLTERQQESKKGEAMETELQEMNDYNEQLTTAVEVLRDFDKIAELVKEKKRG